MAYYDCEEVTDSETLEAVDDYLYMHCDEYIDVNVSNAVVYYNKNSKEYVVENSEHLVRVDAFYIDR